MLELKNITKKLGAFKLNDVSINVEKGDYFILLGSSGAGKSVILETIAGLVRPDNGTIILEGKDITHEKIQHRRIGIVFQDHAVFPHMTVRENIAFPLKSKKLNGDEKKQRIAAIAETLNITPLLNRKPATLSGGELQRVSLARTLVQQPAVLLLDEPLASMDVKLKDELRSLLRSLSRQGQTIIHVTHDYEEAISLGNRIAVVNEGSIVQWGTPDEVFHHPGSSFVARLVGVKNFFSTNIRQLEGKTVAIVDENIRFCLSGEEVSGEGFILFSGSDVLLSNESLDSSSSNNFPGVVREIIPSVHGVEIVIDIGIFVHAIILRESVLRLKIREGSSLWIHVKATALKYIPVGSIR